MRWPGETPNAELRALANDLQMCDPASFFEMLSMEKYGYWPDTDYGYFMKRGMIRVVNMLFTQFRGGCLLKQTYDID